MKRRCALCDEWYNDKDRTEVLFHEHPEPQSGPEREAWLKSGMTYLEWKNS